MPTYEYLCTNQGHRLEVVQKFTDDPLTICPECGGLLRKVIFPVGVVFKGSGFYRNDSRAKQKTAVPSSGGSSSSTDSANGSKESGSGSKESGGSKESAGAWGGDSSTSGNGSSATKDAGPGSGSAKGSPAKAPSGTPAA